MLLLLYLAVTLAPVALAWGAGLPPRPFLDDLSSGLALTAYAAMLVEFVLSGRFRTVSDGIGIDLTMRLHQLLARTALALVLLHPFLYTLPIPGHPPPWDVTAQGYLRLDMASLASGGAAWVLLVVLVATSIGRNALPYSYETWRLGHGLGAALTAGLAAHHALEAGRYSQAEPMAYLWLTLLGLALATLVHVYLLSPLLQLRRPFEVVSVRRIAERTWELVVSHTGGRPFQFRAGQFVWLHLSSTPFTLRENPFSIASAPQDGGKVAFVIKEAGDFTSALGTVKPGQRAWLDGPHGGLALPGPQAPGVGLIAGGVGIAPLLSVLRQMRAAGDPRPVALLYGNRLESQIVYRDELDSLAEEASVSVTHVLGEPP
ncbi:MAG TPA: ferric reductase-like transmembrane domain-containing protein, partial [Thermohalobaculum sp.]|nr:ferric reductase-like transmembrane domain-containing protein [Thermohalobaculum sp.]